jgi:uncharacterized membrane protein
MVKKVEKTDISTEKLVSILFWIFPVGLIWYLVEERLQKDAFVKFHFKQWLVATITLIALTISLSIISFATLGILSVIIRPLYALVMIFYLVWFIQGIIFAANGEKKELFLIGKYVKHLTF